MPKPTPPTTHPATMPRAGAHTRSAPTERSAMPTVRSRVTAATTGAAAGEAPSGTSVSLRMITGATSTGISMRTVPATVGVKMRRSSDILAASANWKRAATMIRLASSAGPPRSSAETQMARNADEVPMTRM